jgi:hypothetical protein
MATKKDRLMGAIGQESVPCLGDRAAPTSVIDKLFVHITS